MKYRIIQDEYTKLYSIQEKWLFLPWMLSCFQDYENLETVEFMLKRLNEMQSPKYKVIK